MFQIADVGLDGYGGSCSCPSEVTSSATCKKSSKVSRFHRRDFIGTHLRPLEYSAAENQQSQYRAYRSVR